MRNTAAHVTHSIAADFSVFLNSSRPSEERVTFVLQHSADDLAHCAGHAGGTFDMFAKVEVNGDGACDLYKTLTALDAKPADSGKVSWNFEKFVIGRNGEVVARFSPRTKPDDPGLVEVIQTELAKE